MLVVLDNNVFISALLESTICQSVVTACDNPAITLVTSNKLIKELRSVLDRPKFKGIINSENKTELLTFIKANAKIVHPRMIPAVCRDPKDNIVLATATVSHAHVIVSGDKDLLVLNPFKGVAILTPREFLHRLKK